MMIEGLSLKINVVFIATTLLTLAFLYYAMVKRADSERSITPMATMVFLFAWCVFLTALSLNGFFLNFASLPPRFVIVLGGPLVAIAIIYGNRKSRSYVLSLPILPLTYLHVIRVPVEIVLWWLYLEGQVPQLMTFEGRNYDILAGFSAPIVAYFALSGVSRSKTVGLIWNLIALVLLLNIVINAVVSTPYGFQLQAFDQPNVGVFYFPFILLPGLVVPAVLFCHIAGILKFSGKGSS